MTKQMCEFESEGRADAGEIETARLARLRRALAAAARDGRRGVMDDIDNVLPLTQTDVDVLILIAKQTPSAVKVAVFLAQVLERAGATSISFECESLRNGRPLRIAIKIDDAEPEGE